MTAKLDGTNGLIQSVDYPTLTTGFTYNWPSGYTTAVFNPGSTLASGTINFPTSSLVEGMVITFSSSQQITALSLSGGSASINNPVTLLPAKTAVSYVYRATGTTWWPMQSVPGILTNGLQLYRLNSDLVGANATGAQSLYGVGVTLAASTVYEFFMYFILSKSAGATSASVSLGFGGTATVNNILYGGASNTNSVVFTSGQVTGATTFDSNTIASTVYIPASASAARSTTAYLCGTVSVNAGGTFIPQYTLSAAPGGAYSTLAGSYMKIYPVGAAGANTNVGSWA